MSVLFMFSGQGAQQVGMGKDLCEQSEVAKMIYSKADAALDWSVSDICFDGPAEKLTESRFCQPALYTTSVACLEVFKDRFPGVKPVGVAGLSLGEYAALYAAGVFSFEDGLRLIAKRAELMDEACKATEGGMACVLGGDIDVIKAACKEVDIDVANYNSPSQVVLSGEKGKVETVVALLKEKGLRKVIPLNVAGAFHSRLMKTAGDKLAAVLEDVPMNAPTLPIAQNVNGKLVTTVDEIKANLVAQVAGSVQWTSCVETLIASGATSAIEFGQGKVLMGLMRQIDRKVKAVSLDTFDKIDAYTTQ